ncbi:hypothetical protein HY229_06375 [Candidatus Acetothermia bacterium]|nr:hypothetical protein [Candidatus Acetothermia bacterium]MBI3643707.1 hypothetical protein [Candidatus Acetothermia bacterium]
MFRWISKLIWLPFGLFGLLWLLHAIDAFKLSLFTGNWLWAVFGVLALAVSLGFILFYWKKSRKRT